MLSSAQCLEADSEHNSRERKHKNKVREKERGKGRKGRASQGRNKWCKSKVLAVDFTAHIGPRTTPVVFYMY